MSDTIKKEDNPEAKTESKGLVSTITDSLGITSPAKPDEPVVKVVEPDEAETEEPVENKQEEQKEEPETPPLDESKEVSEPDSTMEDTSKTSSKKKKKTKKMLFKNKKIQGLLKKIKTSKKTENELLLELDNIVNKKIDIEIKKHNEIIKSLKEQKSALMHRIKKEFTKKSSVYPEMGVRHKKTRKNKKTSKMKPMEPMSPMEPEEPMPPMESQIPESNDQLNQPIPK
jgi:hypothetical protein